MRIDCRQYSNDPQQMEEGETGTDQSKSLLQLGFPDVTQVIDLFPDCAQFVQLSIDRWVTSGGPHELHHALAALQLLLEGLKDGRETAKISTAESPQTPSKAC